MAIIGCMVLSDFGTKLSSHSGILQLMDLKPSHVVMPAIHIKREQVGKMMEEKLAAIGCRYDPARKQFV